MQRSMILCATFSTNDFNKVEYAAEFLTRHTLYVSEIAADEEPSSTVST